MNINVADERIVKGPPSKSYTLDELEQLAREYLKESPLTDTLTLELILSSLIAWARKREREVGDAGD